MKLTCPRRKPLIRALAFAVAAASARGTDLGRTQRPGGRGHRSVALTFGDEQSEGPKAQAVSRLRDRFEATGNGIWRLSRREVTPLAGGE
jgi:hypothetical protein